MLIFYNIIGIIKIPILCFYYFVTGKIMIFFEIIHYLQYSIIHPPAVTIEYRCTNSFFTFHLPYLFSRLIDEDDIIILIHENDSNIKAIHYGYEGFSVTK